MSCCICDGPVIDKDGYRKVNGRWICAGCCALLGIDMLNPALIAAIPPPIPPPAPAPERTKVASERSTALAGEKLVHAHGVAITRLVALHYPPACPENIDRARQTAIVARDRAVERFQKSESLRTAGRAVIDLLERRGSLDNHGHNPWPAHDSACEVCRTLNALRGAIEVLDLDDQKPDLQPVESSASSEAVTEALPQIVEAERRAHLWDAILQCMATVDDGKSLGAARKAVERAFVEVGAPATSEPAPTQPIPYADVVNGRALRGGLDAFEARACHRIAVEQGIGDPNAETIELLSDAVRLTRECHDTFARYESILARASARARELEQAQWRPKVEALERALAERKEREATLYAALDRPCPITGEPFFMVIEAPGGEGWVPTYGGPYDSYGPCERTDPHGDLTRWWYDHDDGRWRESIGLGLRVIDPDAETEAPEEPAAPAPTTQAGSSRLVDSPLPIVYWPCDACKAPIGKAPSTPGEHWGWLLWNPAEPCTDLCVVCRACQEQPRYSKIDYSCPVEWLAGPTRESLSNTFHGPTARLGQLLTEYVWTPEDRDRLVSLCVAASTWPHPEYDHLRRGNP